MGRFSVDRSMNVGGQPPSPTMPQTQQYGQPNYGSPYGQQMPQQQGMMQQPQLPAGWIHQSYSLHELRRTDEAFQFLHAIVLKFPEESVIPYNLACYACQMGQLDVAQRWLNQAVRIGGKASVKEMAEQDADLEPLRSYIEAL